MSDAQLKKIEDECAKLEAELLLMNNAMETAKACDELVKFIQEHDEPLHPDSTVSSFISNRETAIPIFQT